MNLVRPSSGRATVLGVDSARLTARELAQIGYVSEVAFHDRSLSTGSGSVRCSADLQVRSHGRPDGLRYNRY
jgi:ABC-type multidrug transport system ATPase subunit